MVAATASKSVIIQTSAAGTGRKNPGAGNCLVIGFKSSTALSAAYGIAVTGEMLVTAILLLVVMRQIWRWRLIAALAVVTPLLIIDAGFFAFLMQTRISGRKLLSDRTKADDVPLDFLLTNLMKNKPATVPGTAIFLTSEVEGAPTALLHSLKHYKVLHEHNVILSVVTSGSPIVPDDEKIHFESFNPATPPNISDFRRDVLSSLAFSSRSDPDATSARIWLRKHSDEHGPASLF